MTTATAAAAAGPLSSDHINYLILRYLQEYGHEASATAFYRDWRRSAEYHNPEDLPFAHSVRRNELVSVIQDGLYHDELISSVRKEGRRFNFTTNGAPASGSRPGTAGKGKGRIEQVRRGTEDFPTPPPKRQRKSEEAPQQERQVNGAAEAMDVDAGSPSAGDAEEDAEAASPAVQTPEPEIIEVPERYDSMDVAVQTEGKTGPKTSTMYWRTPRPDASLMHGTFSPAKSDRMLFTAGDGASQLYHMPSDFESGADQIISVDVGGVAAGSIVTACAWDPQGHTLAYAVDFKRDIGVGGKQEKRQDISSLDSRTGQAAQYGSPTLLEPPGLVMALRYSWDGSQLLAVRTNGSRGSVEVWDVESGSRAKPANAISARAWWMFESRAIDAAWVSPTDFTVCGDDGLLQRFHVTGSESQGEGNMDVQAPGRRGLENVTSPSIPPEAQHLSFVKIRAEPPSNHDAAKGGINFVAMTSDGYTMVQAVASQTGSRFAQSSEASEPATALAVIRPCDRFKDFDEKSGETILATARDSGIFTINKLRPDSPLELSATCTLADDSSALALAWSPDSSYLAVCGVDIIQIWETLPLAYPSQRDHATRSLPPQPIVTWRRDKALASKGVRNGEHAANGQNEQDLEPSLTWSGDGESLALAVRNEIAVIRFRPPLGRHGEEAANAVNGHVQPRDRPSDVFKGAFPARHGTHDHEPPPSGPIFAAILAFSIYRSCQTHLPKRGFGRPERRDQQDELAKQKDYCHDKILAWRPYSSLASEGTGHQVCGAPKGHKFWGLTIFRCTYGDDEAWSQLLKLIREEVRKSAELYGAPDLMDAFNLKVFEDTSVLEGASKIELRKMFINWRSEVAVEEERIDEPGASPILIPDGRGGTRGTKQRYNYFVQIDEESLYSIIDRETKTHTRDYGLVLGHVNVISADWELPDPQYYAEIRAADNDEDPSDYEDPVDEGEEPLEGCRLYDVGWMKTNISVSHVGTQQILTESVWDHNYVRPPGIADYF